MKARPLLLLAMLVLLSAVAPPPAGCGPGDAAAGPAAAGATGDGAAGDAARPEGLSFRRNYVPADGRDEWPLGKAKYVPVDPAEFERLASDALAKPADSPAAPAAHVAVAEYRARLAGDFLTEGEAELQVESSSPSPTLLHLESCALAISDPQWSGPPPRSAALGTGVDGRPALLVDGAGQLQFAWSLGGRRDASEIVRFDVSLPPCPSNRLLLDLPDGSVPLVDRGMTSAAGAVEDGYQRWQIELGGYHRFSLEVVPEGRAAQPGQLALVRSSVVYDVSPKGLDASAQFKLDLHGEAAEPFVVVLDAGLQPVSVESGGKPLPWSTTKGEAGEPTRVTVFLPPAPSENGPTLLVKAIGPVQLAAPWRLPRIQPKNVFWQEGKATLLIPSELVAQRLDPLGCRQTSAGTLAPPRQGESAQFQYFAPDATVEIVLDERATTTRVETATTVALAPGEVTARAVADFTTASGAVFLLEGTIAPSWLVDSVESVPADMIEQWNVEKRGGAQRLAVRLVRALAPSRPLRLVVSARSFRSPLSEPLGIDDLVPVRFSASQFGSRLIAVRAAEPYRLQIRGSEELRRLDPAGLDGQQLDRFPEPPEGLLFEDAVELRDLEIGLQDRTAGYAGAVGIEAWTSDSLLHEAYRLRCEPDSVPIGRVLVRFVPARSQPRRFTLGGEGAEPLAARKLPPAEQVALGLDAADDTWQVALPKPQAAPFEIRTSREVPLDRPQPISLASLPQAARQRGTLEIRRLGTEMIRVVDCRLEAVPVEPAAAGQSQTACTMYRFDPATDAAEAAAPAVVVAAAGAVTPPVWIWDCRVESRYAPDGGASHRATCHVQNEGAVQLRLRLPAEAEAVRGVWVDGRPAGGPRTTAGEMAEVVVALPQGRRYPSVVLDFTTSGGGLGMLGSIEPPMPETDVPVLARHWTVWLPPGYIGYGDDSRWQPPQAEPTSLAARILGPLGRDSGRPALDLLHPAGWFAGAPASAEAAEAVERIDAVAASGDAATGTMTWGGLLAHPAWNSASVRLLVDRSALRDLGLAPRTSLVPSAAGDLSAGGTALLRDARLALLVHPQAMLITSQTQAALSRASLEAMSKDTVWRVLPGPLDRRLQAAAAGAADPSFLPAAVWARSAGGPPSAWTGDEGTGAEAGDAAGWSAYRLDVPATVPVSLRYVHGRSTTLAGAVTLLLVVAFCRWMLAGRLGLFWVLAGIGAVASVFLPDACTPLGNGLLLGAAFCVLRELTRRPRGRPTREAGSPSAPGSASLRPAPGSTATAHAASGRAMMLLAAAATLLAAPGAQAARSASEAPPLAVKQYNVFIPTDDQQKPTGDKYYVPEELYARLLRSASRSEEPQGWLISGATYRGTVSRDAASGQLQVAEIQAAFALHVFQRGATVSVPLRRETASLLPDGALLDGRPLQAEWQPDGAALRFEIADPGEYRLELALRPVMVEAGGGRGGFDLATPPVPSSRLELTTADEGLEIEVPSAGGAVRRQTDPARVVADLGPADLLSVRWASQSAAGAPGPAVDVEQLLWLKVQPGSVVLDARFRLKVIEGQLEELDVTPDSVLRLLPSQDPAAPAAEARATPGQAQTIVFRWPEPIADAAEFEARFLLPGTSDVGNIRLPHLEPVNARTTRRWLAVSADPLLELHPQTDNAPEAIGVPDFLKLWGEAQPQPSAAYRLPPGETPWSIAARPREPRTAVDETLVLGFGDGETRLLFHADLTTTAGYNFQYRITAPPHLAIDRVSLRAGSTERAVRWSQDRAGTITLFLNGPVAGGQELVLEGRLPTPMGKRLSLPQVVVEQAERRGAVVQVFRRPAVQVTLSRVKQLEQPAAQPNWTDGRNLGRLVGQYQTNPDQPAGGTFTLTENRPEVRARQVTWLWPSGAAWKARVDCQLEASGGLLDAACFEIPKSLGGPYQAVPPALCRAWTTADGKPRVSIEPAEAVSDSYRFSFTSPVATAAGEPVEAPDVALLDARQCRRLLALPVSVQGLPVTWETEGLRPAELPERSDSPPDAGEYLFFEAVDSPVRARLRPAGRRNAAATIRQADVRIVWRADGSFRGAAWFDLDPGNATQCPLRLPAGYRLVNVSVAGAPVSPVPAGEDAWQLPLGPARLPQGVEVIFEGVLPGPPDDLRHRFPAPALGQLPVEATLWTIIGPPALRPLLPDQAARTLVPWQQEMARLKTIAAVMQSGALVSQSEPEDIRRWYRRSAGRLVAARRAVQRRLAEAPITPQTRAALIEAQTIDREQADLAERLGTVQILAELSARAPAAADSPDLWWDSAERPAAIGRYATAAGAHSITLSYASVAPSQWGRWGAAVGIVAVLGLAWLGLRRRAVRWRLKKWPHAAGVAAGLAWWLWLAPSVLGLAIVAVSVAAALRSGWRHASPPPPSSIIALREVVR